VLKDRLEAPKVTWDHAKHLATIDDGNHWMANKAMFNFSVKPMPNIGPPSAGLWKEFAAERVDISAQIPVQSTDMVRHYFAGLERPITLLHTKGNSFQKAKSVPDDLAVEIYRSILDEIGGTLILLDWDNRVPRIAHGRIKHLTDDWKRLGVEELLAAIQQADLVVGIDSGPLHLCRYTNTPAIGLWFSEHHPAKFSLPREQQVNVVLKKNGLHGNKHTRWFYNIVEEQGEQIRAGIVGRLCRQLLTTPRYLSQEQLGKDVMIQHWINDWTRAGISTYRTFIDRDESFDLMLPTSLRIRTAEDRGDWMYSSGRRLAWGRVQYLSSRCLCGGSRWKIGVGGHWGKELRLCQQMDAHFWQPCGGLLPGLSSLSGMAFRVDGGGVFGAVEIDVLLGEVAGIDGVAAGAEVEVDGDGELRLFDDLLHLGDGRFRGEAAFAGQQAAEEDVDELLTNPRAGITDGVDDAAPVRVATMEAALHEQ
jgi:hypothetical protein